MESMYSQEQERRTPFKETQQQERHTPFIKTRQPGNMPGTILYLLLSFPLGLIYFILTVVGLSLGLGTVIIWIGLPILLLTLLLLRGIAALERDMVASMLHITMPYVAPLQTNGGKPNMFRWLRASVQDPITWRTLLYVFLKFPMGILAFTLALTLPLLSLCLLLNPLTYTIDVYVQHLVLLSHPNVNWHDYIPFATIEGGRFDPLMFLTSFLGIPCGILLWMGTRYILTGFAQGWGLLVRAILAPTQPTMAQPKDEPYRPYNM